MKSLRYFLVVFPLCLLLVSNAVAGELEKQLIHAAMEGDAGAVQALLARGAKVDGRDDLNGSTALMMAANGGNVKVARLLIEKGADVNAEDESTSTALMMAANNDKTDVARLLIEKGADVNKRTIIGGTALMYANSTEMAKLLIDKGADVNARNNEGKTVLNYAVEMGAGDIVKLLKAAGAK